MNSMIVDKVKYLSIIYIQTFSGFNGWDVC